MTELRHRDPNDSELVVITGRRGSGKSMGGLDQLSRRSFDEMPWFVLDFKHDDLAAQIPTSAPPMKPEDDLPADPGLYAVRCDINDAGRDSEVDRLLCEIYEHGNAGVFIDEGMFLGQWNNGLRRIALAGRSRHVPLIFVTQRLIKCDTDALAETDWIQSFAQVHPDDIDRVGSFIPRNRVDFEALQRRGKFHSYVYNTADDDLRVHGPGADFPAIYDRMLERLPVYVDEAEMRALMNVPPPRRLRV